MRLEGKVAIVTGSAQGIGRAIAERFAEEGAAVVINDISAEAGDKAAKAITAKGWRAVCVAGDVSKLATNKALVDAALKQFGRLDIFVCNAGITHWNKSMFEVTEEEFDKIFAVNVKGIYQAANAATPAFDRQKSGNFIIIASAAGLRPRLGLTWYNTSKGAAITAAKSMASELASRGIRVNAICPAATDTPLLPHFMGGDNAENRARFEAGLPLGRIGQPLDQANAALFLASDEASFITGVALEVDGGRCI